MEFRILGPLEVVQDGRTLELGRPKQRALLGLLLLRAGQAVSADRLVEELWHGRPPAQAMASLQSYVSNLRRVLEPDRGAGEPPQLLVRRAAGYVAQIDPSDLDASRFEAGLARARRAAEAGDHALDERLLVEGLALWRDDPLAGLADEIEAVPEISRLVELRLAATEERAEAALALGRHAELVADLDASVREQPLRERLRAALALALYRVGRHADALERLREGRRLLSDELGLSPGPELRELEQQILQHAPELRWLPRPEPRSTRGPVPERVLVGREEELAPLSLAWAEAVEGRGAVALISGEPGIGKTRLAEEVAADAAADGALTLWGRASDAGGAPAFWPWTQVLDAAAAELDEDALRLMVGAHGAELARIVPELSGRLGVQDEPGGDALEARFQLYDAVVRFVLRLASHRPLAIVLDDLHWADAPTLELLRWLGGRLRAAPVLVVATYRDSEADRGAALTETLAGLTREAPLVRVHLEGLTLQEVSLLVAQHLAVQPPDELASALHAQTDGNAFYLSELVRLVQERGAPSWDEIPGGIRDVIERRVRALPEQTVELVEAAAVVGRDFDLPTVAAAHGVTPDALLELLDPALAARVVIAAGDSPFGYRFAHALVRETVYGWLSASRRTRLHAAAGAALERHGGRTRLSEVAFHYEQAAPLGFAEQAVDAALAAAEQAAQMLALEQAEAHLRQALRLLEQTGDGGNREAAVQARLTLLLMMSSGYSAPALAEAAARVRERAARGGAVPELASVLWALWTYQIVSADLDEALRIADELTGRGRELADPIALAAGLHARGTTILFSGDPAGGMPSLTAALETLHDVPAEQLERAGLAHMAIHVHCHAAHALALLGESEEADAHVRAALERADATTRPFDHAFVLIYAGWVPALRHDLQEASRWLRKAVDYSDEHGFPQLAAFGGAPYGWVEALRGEPDAGAARIEAALRAMQDSGGRLVRHWHLALLAEALVALDEGIAAWRDTGAAIHHSELLRLKGELLLRRGHDEDGLALLEEAVAAATRQGAVLLRARAEETLAAAAASIA